MELACLTWVSLCAEQINRSVWHLSLAVRAAEPDGARQDPARGATRYLRQLVGVGGSRQREEEVTRTAPRKNNEMHPLLESICAVVLVTFCVGVSLRVSVCVCVCLWSRGGSWDCCDCVWCCGRVCVVGST